MGIIIAYPICMCASINVKKRWYYRLRTLHTRMQFSSSKPIKYSKYIYMWDKGKRM